MNVEKQSFSNFPLGNKGKIIGIISLKGGSENQRFSGLLLDLEVYSK